jgi:pantetheine-phosphate adenylyltransferase
VKVLWRASERRLITQNLPESRKINAIYNTFIYNDDRINKKSLHKIETNQNFFLLGDLSPIMPQVAVGGTFQYLHDGHAKLLEKAFEIAQDGRVHIGLTSDEMLQKSHDIESYESRRAHLLQYLKEKGYPEDRYEVVSLNDPCGPTLEENFDYIVVSPETYPVALKINNLREKRGKKSLEIVYVEYVMAEDGIPISSTRIAKGEIDRHGKLKRKD